MEDREKLELELELLMLEKEKRRRAGSLENNSQPKSSIGEDVLSGVAGVPGRYLEHLAGLFELPSELNGALGQSPGRFGKNVLAGFGKLGRSLLNIPSNTVNYLHEKEAIPDWVRAWRPSEEIQNFDYAKGVGLDDQQPGDALFQGLAEKSPSAIAAAQGYLPLMATEAIQAIGNKENPITNALTGGAEKLSGKIAEKTAKAVPIVAKSISNEKMAKNLVAREAKELSHSKKTFNNVFNKTPENGRINLEETPKLKIDNLLESATAKELKSLKKYLSEPTIRKAHVAQSGLGGIERRLEKALYEKSSLTNEQIKALNEAKRAKKQLISSLDKSFKKYGGESLANDYRAGRAHYKENVVPYKKLALHKYKTNKKKAGNLIRELAADDDFMLSVGKQYHPEIAFSDITSSILNKVGLGTKNVETAKLIKELK